jgi:hypothetical protein
MFAKSFIVVVVGVDVADVAADVCLFVVVGLC